MAVVDLELPAGFRFHPTDEELVNHYLCRKCSSLSISVHVIQDLDLYKFDPWQLPEMAVYGEKEWYFFSPRDRKYPNGSRPNRAAGTGYWKATGADKPIGKPKTLGIKKALVFYAGKAPKGVKTNWIMHEYRLANVDRSASKNNNLRLDDWVLCRIYNKKGIIEKKYHNNSNNIIDNTVVHPKNMNNVEMEDRKSDIVMSTPKPEPVLNDQLNFDMSDSIHKLNTGSSCCSEQVFSPPCDREVQSRPKWHNVDDVFDFGFSEDPSSYVFPDDPFGSQVQYQMDQHSSLQDMFMLLQKPF